MMRKVWLGLAIFAAAALAALVFHGWRLGAFELLPVGANFCG